MTFRRLILVTALSVLTLVVATLAPIGADTVSAPTTTSTTTSTTSTTSTTTTTLPPTTTTTLVPLGFEPVCGEPLMRLALEVGWLLEDLPDLDRVAARESGADCGNTDTNLSNNAADPQYCGNGIGSAGTMQVNSYWAAPTRWHNHPGGWLGEQGILDSCDDLFDVRTNLTAALAIFHRSGWSPWGG